MKNFEINKIQNYLNNKFITTHYQLKDDGKQDSVEVYFKGEFIGLIYKVEDEGETSYQFQMAILDEDLLDS